jgi:hypothetical protein
MKENGGIDKNQSEDKEKCPAENLRQSGLFFHTQMPLPPNEKS